VSGEHLAVIVLAAGEGTRMRSALPKVLHEVCGLPMVRYVLDAARTLRPDRIVVVTGHGSDAVEAAIAAPDVTFAFQAGRLGTGDAVASARDAARGADRVLVLNGDEPLVSGETLARLCEAARGQLMAFTSQKVPDGGALGRVLRDAHGGVQSIVQAADLEDRAGPAEVNWGQYVFDAAWLWEALTRVPVSAKGEYYLTKLADFAHEAGRPAVTVTLSDAEALGLDDRVKLAEAERRMRSRILERHMLDGVTIRDPATTYIDGAVELGHDVTVLPGCHLLGSSSVGERALLGPNSTLRNSTVGADCVIESSIIEDSVLGDRVHAGPFAHVRGGARISDDCYLGNYAEVKNSTLGREVKMHHFSYVGDADVGERANIAAGVITCNYDGVNKNRTTIGAGAFIGCDTMLVAPVTVGDGSLTGAGSVVNHDVPDGARVAGVPARRLPGRRPEGER
jgi:bifunctional UDP-N-acetylglucosamine pyrophosphorylase/glucosamine-1-phosphate N-acetyltransferase